MAWNESTMAFFNFSKFFGIFFYASGRNETKRNETIIFIFHISHPFPTYFGLEWTIIVFLFLFFEFFTIFMEFSIRHRLGTEQNGTIIFISLFLIFFQPILAWNEFLMVFFNFLNCFAIFFYSSGRNETKRNDNFYFTYFSSFSDLFWLEMNHNRI